MHRLYGEFTIIVGSFIFVECGVCFVTRRSSLLVWVRESFGRVGCGVSLGSVFVSLVIFCARGIVGWFGNLFTLALVIVWILFCGVMRFCHCKCFGFRLSLGTILIWTISHALFTVVLVNIVFRNRVIIADCLVTVITAILMTLTVWRIVH